MRTTAIVTGCLVAAWLGWAQGSAAPRAVPVQPRDQFRQSLQDLVAYSPDPCGAPYGREDDWHSSAIESRLFQAAATIVVDALNEDAAGAQAPKDRAATALRRLADESARINTGWPQDNRFHFEVLDLRPALVVKMGVRTHERFSVFGIPEESPGKAHRAWSEVGSGSESTDVREVARSALRLFALHRGPPGNARFLARFDLVGCAGSTGVAYDAREWKPEGAGELAQIFKQSGAFGMDDRVPGFAPIGQLKTEGALVTIPYCWFSAIDTWDNPSMCAVDTYDLSGDNTKFISRAYNRPDLLPVAKAIEYAEQRDYGALMGYCASARAAGSMIRDLPPFVFAGVVIQVTPTGNGKERVELGGGAYRFDVEKRAGRWLVVAFRSQ